MSEILKHNLEEFHSALQLSIDSQVLNILSNPEVISLSFENKKPEDKRWKYFERISEGEWKKIDKVFLYQISQGFINLGETTQFLLITRLRKENIIKIAELQPEYKKYAEKIFGPLKTHSSDPLKTLEEVQKFIFNRINDLPYQSVTSKREKIFGFQIF